MVVVRPQAQLPVGFGHHASSFSLAQLLRLLLLTSPPLVTFWSLAAALLCPVAASAARPSTLAVARAPKNLINPSRPGTAPRSVICNLGCDLEASNPRQLPPRPDSEAALRSHVEVRQALTLELSTILAAAPSAAHLRSRPAYRSIDCRDCEISSLWNQAPGWSESNARQGRPARSVRQSASRAPIASCKHTPPQLLAILARASLWPSPAVRRATSRPDPSGGLRLLSIERNHCSAVTPTVWDEGVLRARPLPQGIIRILQLPRSR